MKMNEAQEKKEKYVELRAINGYSLSAIAGQLQMSKTTLIKWEKELDKEIRNAKHAYTESLVDSLSYCMLARVDRLLMMNEKLLDELEKREITSIDTEKLYKLALESFQKTNSFLTGNSFSDLVSGPYSFSTKDLWR